MIGAYDCLNNWALLHFPDLFDLEICPLKCTDRQSLAFAALCSVKLSACCIASVQHCLSAAAVSHNQLI